MTGEGRHDVKRGDDVKREWWDMRKGKTLDPGVKRRDDGRREVCRARGRMTEGGVGMTEGGVGMTEGGVGMTNQGGTNGGWITGKYKKPEMDEHLRLTLNDISNVERRT